MYHIQEMAYTALAMSNVTNLPIDMLEFGTEGFSWLVVALSEAIHKGVVKSKLREYAESHDGCAIVFDDGQTVIIYKDSLSYAERNHVLAHEVGHIVLKHTAHNGILGKSADLNIEDQQEKEANYFSTALLAPLRLLADDNITDPAYISKVTHVPMETAITIAGELQEYKKTRKTKAEKALSKKFHTRAYKRDRLLNYSIVGVCSFVLTAAILTLSQNINSISKDVPPQAIITTEASATPIEEPTPSLTPTETPAPPTQQKTVYAIDYNHKYHNEWCRHIAHVDKSDLIEMAIVEALEQLGRSGACLDCNPLADYELEAS